MKSLKTQLFEFRKELTVEQTEIVTIVTEHLNLCNDYSEKEITGSLNKYLESFGYYDNVKTLLGSLDKEINENSLYYTLKDLYAKVSRKDNRFLYEQALHTILNCINQSNDEDRKIKVVENLALYEWIPEVQMFLFEMAATPQEKMNLSSKGGKVEDVVSIALQISEGFLVRVHDAWFILSKDGIKSTLLENYVKNEVELKKLRLLEQTLTLATFKGKSINFKLNENTELSINSETGKIYLDGNECEAETTLETLFNSPVIPFEMKALYPILVETINNRKKFVVLDSVKKAYNITNNAFECYLFNYNNNIYQYRVDKFSGNSTMSYGNAQAVIENVIHELGVDVTFFYENMLSEELKAKNELEKKEMKMQEGLTNVETAILILKENNQTSGVYNSLLAKRHKLAEELKAIKNEKNKYLA